MEIEVGKKYRTRGGHIVEVGDKDDRYISGIYPSGDWWKLPLNGKVSEFYDSSDDLVEEIKEDTSSTQNSENELKENPMSEECDTVDNREPEQDELRDNINPKYYTDMAISPHEYNKVNDISWNEAQVIKYVSRWKDKNGLEDLKKAKWYLDDLIEGIEVE